MERSIGYINPLLDLPAGRALLALPAEQRAPLEAVLRELREQANEEAERSWKRRKAPMAAYWRAVSTYARHTAHALSEAGQKGRVVQRQSDNSRATTDEDTL